MRLTDEQACVRELSDKLVALQRPIRILDAIKWDASVKDDFFKHGCQRLPKVDASYYKERPLPFDAHELMAEFHALAREIKNKLGHYTSISRMMTRLCDEYALAIHMLSVRGEPLFSELSMDLYGSPSDVFYPNGPKLSELGHLLGDILQGLSIELSTDADEKKYTAQQTLDILQERLSNYFNTEDHVTVKISDDIIADAAAGADTIKLNENVMFSDRDIRYLEVHEAWVHVGTTLNGASQPYCTFLSKGSPSSSVTQEGLAVTTEIFTFSSSPDRMLKITNRVRALSQIQNGADFLDIFKFFLDQGLNEEQSYAYSTRVFRGSTPDGGPFTKDLSYAKGFVLIYNYIRLAIQKGFVDRIPFLFVGKTLLEDIPTLYELHQQGLVTKPQYLPPQFRDLSGISSWMGFSLFLNQFDLEALASNYSHLLR